MGFERRFTIVTLATILMLAFVALRGPSAPGNGDGAAALAAAGMRDAANASSSRVRQLRVAQGNVASDLPAQPGGFAVGGGVSGADRGVGGFPVGGNPRLPDGDVSPLVLSLRTSLRNFKAGTFTSEDLLAANADPYNDDLPNTAPNGSVHRKRLLIGVLSDPKSLRTLGMAAYTTWIEQVSKTATVYFFIGSCLNPIKGFPGKVVCLDTPDAYPPQKKVFLMWSYVWRHHSDEYEWIMKVDHDAYLNVDHMAGLLADLGNPNNLRTYKYIGMPAVGREQEREKLGLNGRPYCSGLGYLMNYRTVKAIGPHTSVCLSNSVSNHSDTEVGRCVQKHTNADCEASPAFAFKQVYYQQDGDRVFPMKLVKGGQMKLTFPEYPKSVHFSSGLLHPLKRAEDFYRFHKQAISHLRPIQPQIAKETSDPNSYRQAVAELRQTCVNNALRQLEKSSFYLKECPTPVAEEQPVVPAEAYVLTRDIPEAAEAFHETEGVLAQNDIKAVKVLVSGWRGEKDASGVVQTNYRQYLQEVLQIFKNAAATGTRRVFLLEDQIVFLCDFKAQFWQLVQNPRCGAHLYTERSGGVLLLGAHEVDPDGLQHIESDRSQAFSEYNHDVKAALCYNANSQTRASFAGIYHRSTFGEILSWISSVLDGPDGELLPFDGALMHLADKGYIVRAAFPNLVLRALPAQTGGEVDEAKQIAVRLRWYEGKYCSRSGELSSV